MKNAIIVENLRKSYQANEVIHGISFEVKKGETFALLGINGAGKTTTLECLEGLRKFESGSIEINGKKGIQLQSSSLPKNMKAKEALEFFACWDHVSVNKEYLEKVGVSPFLNKQYGQLSTGQKRRLHLAIAMLGNPDILFLDEPTAGLDVEGRFNLHQEIKGLKEQGKTIIIASHDMTEVSELCDRIAILKDGHIAFIGTSTELTKSFQEYIQLQVRFSVNPNFEELNTIPIYQNEYFIFETNNLTTLLLAISRLANKQNIQIIDLKIDQESLEKRFLTITKESTKQ